MDGSNVYDTNYLLWRLEGADIWWQLRYMRVMTNIKFQCPVAHKSELWSFIKIVIYDYDFLTLCYMLLGEWVQYLGLLDKDLLQWKYHNHWQKVTHPKVKGAYPPRTKWQLLRASVNGPPMARAIWSTVKG